MRCRTTIYSNSRNLKDDEDIIGAILFRQRLIYALEDFQRIKDALKEDFQREKAQYDAVEENFQIMKAFYAALEDNAQYDAFEMLKKRAQYDTVKKLRIEAQRALEERFRRMKAQCDAIEDSRKKVQRLLEENNGPRIKALLSPSDVNNIEEYSSFNNTTDRANKENLFLIFVLIISFLLYGYFVFPASNLF